MKLNPFFNPRIDADFHFQPDSPPTCPLRPVIPLNEIQAGEMVEFASGVKGIALNLDNEQLRDRNHTLLEQDILMEYAKQKGTLLSCQAVIVVLKR